MRLWGHGRLAVPLLLFLALGLSGVSAASPVRLSADVGFDGYIVPGTWMPMRIETVAQSSFDGVLEVDVSNPRGTARTFRFPMRVVGGAAHQTFVNVVIPDPRYPLALRLLRDGQEVGHAVIVLGGTRAADSVVVVLARDASGFEFLTSLSGRVRAAYLREETLPIQWQSYEGVRAVVIRDLEDTRMQAPQRQALREWVAQGGRLAVAAPELLRTTQPQWLMELLPGVPTNGMVTQPLTLAPGHKDPVTVELVTPRLGATVWPNSLRPELLQWRYGRGIVAMWTFDSLGPTLRTSPTVLQHWQTILTDVGAAPLGGRGLVDIVPTTPVLPGTAQAAIAVAVVAYVVALRWGLYRAAFRRGWVALAAVVLCGGTLLYGTAVSARDAVAAITQVTLVEGIPGVGLARVTTYAALTSAFGEAVQVVGPPQAVIRPLTGAAVIVVDGPPTIDELAPLRREVFELTQMIPVAVRGTSARTGEGIRVEIENPDGLQIRNPVIYLDGQTYRVPKLHARTAFLLDPAQAEPSDRQPGTVEDLAGRLRQWTFVRFGADAILNRDRPMLVGWLEDARLTVRSPQAKRGTAAALLVVPLASP